MLCLRCSYLSVKLRERRTFTCGMETWRSSFLKNIIGSEVPVQYASSCELGDCVLWLFYAELYIIVGPILWPCWLECIIETEYTTWEADIFVMVSNCIQHGGFSFFFFNFCMSRSLEQMFTYLRVMYFCTPHLNRIMPYKFFESFEISKFKRENRCVILF